MRKMNAMRVEEITARPVASNTTTTIRLHTPSPQSAFAYRNRLLQALPPDDVRRFGSALELIRLSSGQELSVAGVPASYVYFPVDAIVSLVCLTADGGCTEVASVGNEGVIGVNLFVGGSAGSTQAVVQCAGLAYRIKAQLLRDQFNQSAATRQVLLRYMQALLLQSAQMTVCNRHHTVEQQLCRWLLLALDRSSSSQLNLTQETIANALGVRRAGVTEAASKLRKAGMLRCQRGRIVILDRARLEEHACECYDVISNELDAACGCSGHAQPSHAERVDFRIRPQARDGIEALLPAAATSRVVVKQLSAQEMRPAANALHYVNGFAR